MCRARPAANLPTQPLVNLVAQHPARQNDDRNGGCRLFGAQFRQKVKRVAIRHMVIGDDDCGFIAASHTKTLRCVRRVSDVDPAFRKPARQQPVDVVIVVHQQYTRPSADLCPACARATAADSFGETRINLRQCRVEIAPEVRPLTREVGTKSLTSFRSLRILTASHDDNFERRPARLEQMSACRQAIHFRHVDVDEEDCGPNPTGLEERLHSVGCGLDFEAEARTMVRQQPQHRRVIVHDQHLWNAADR